MNPKPNSPSMTKRRYIHLFILAVVGLVLYSNAFGSPFVYDDKWYILENVPIRDLSNFLSLLGTRHVTLLSFAINYAFAGYDPIVFNLTNISIHIINAMLLYTLVSLIIRTPVMRVESERPGLAVLPLICALIFLVHPIETQAVNYITQRFASLATFFYLISVVSFLKARLYSTEGATLKPARFLFYALALIAALVAQVTKEISFTLPFVIVLFEFVFFTNTEGLKKRILYLLPLLTPLFIIPAILFMPSMPEVVDGSHVLTAAGKLKSLQMEELKELSRLTYLFTEFRVIVTYIRLLLFPVGQNLLYNYPKYSSLFAPQVFLSLLFLASLFFGAFYWLIRSRRAGDALGVMLSIGILWFFITISIESSIIPIQHVIFEHRTYLPSVGFFMAAGAALLYLAGFLKFIDGRRLSSVGWAVIVVILVILSLLTYKRNIVWSSELNLWSDVALKNHEYWGVQNNLGLAYDKSGESEKAKQRFKEAMRLNPKASGPHNNIGQIYFREGDDKRALFHYKESLKRDKGKAEAKNNIANLYKNLGDTDNALVYYTEALRLKPLSDDIIFNLAGLYKQIGDMAEAQKNYNEAIRLAPTRGIYYFGRGIFYKETGNVDKAVENIKEAVRLSPGLEGAHENLAALYYMKGSFDEAVANFKKALIVSPASDNIHYNLAMTYQAMGNGTQAKIHYKESIRLNPSVPDAHYNLGFIFLVEGKKELAKQEFNKALRIAPGYTPARDALEKM